MTETTQKRIGCVLALVLWCAVASTFPSFMPLEIAAALSVMMGGIVGGLLMYRWMN